jgi:hypothetical protein
VELFFKWIKQHLRLRAFYGRSENAVRCQIWSAICACLLVAIVKKKLKIQKTLNEMLQIMPPPVLCRAPKCWRRRSGRFLTFWDIGVRHNHRLSKKASS